MKYFIPEWDDRVDPKYDFINDRHSEAHRKNGDVYIWDIFGYSRVPIDGVLVSRVKALMNKKKYRALLEQGVQRYYRYQGEFIGDCGAFGYINEKKPPFKTADTLKYYLKAGFDYGTSIDHLIVKSIRTPSEEKRELTLDEKKERWQITIENAREMYELWQSKDEYLSKIRIIGAIQGWDVPSYRRAARELLQVGYNYLGIGGLARRPTTQIVNILMGVCYEVRKFAEKTKKKVDIHTFGVARPKIIPLLYSLGITSFDSAVFLRMAWMRAGRTNYLTSEKTGYVAVRVRSPDKIKDLPLERRESLKPFEQKVLSLLRGYDQGQTPFEAVLKPLEEYEKATGGIIPISEYARTLKNREWKSCDCTICSKLGIEVVIFRGNNRNRRRGFHNTHIFYKWLRNAVPRVMIFTNCTGKKNSEPQLMPAYARYLASPVFKAFWNHVYDLPFEIKILSAKFGLIDCTDQIPYYDKKMETSDIPIYTEELKTKLRYYNKVFFIGLGLYRKVAERVKEEANYDVEIFPKMELTERGKLDIIEYTKQLRFFRDAVIDFLPETCRPKSIEEFRKIVRRGLEKYF